MVAVAEGDLEVGSTANSYAILARLATGGMAELFLARNASGADFYVDRAVVDSNQITPETLQTATPEPSSFELLLLGAASIFAGRSHRRF